MSLTRDCAVSSLHHCGELRAAAAAAATLLSTLPQTSAWSVCLHCTMRLISQFVAQVACALRCGHHAFQLRHFSASVSSLPPNLASQVDEFNREMEALFGLHDHDGAEPRSITESPSFDSWQSQALPSDAIAAPASSMQAVKSFTNLASASAPNRGDIRELRLINLSIDTAFASGELSERECRYLGLMLRNNDPQLLRLAGAQQLQPPRPSQHSPAQLLPPAGLLQVLDERISHALLKLYEES